VGEAVLFARSATAGGQSMPVHWGGDNSSSFTSMAESLRGGLSLAFSGFGYWSHDIGGFEGDPDPAVFKRWLAFGLLSSHSRLHGSTSYRVPWAFDDGDEAAGPERGRGGAAVREAQGRRCAPTSSQAARRRIARAPDHAPDAARVPGRPAVAHLDRQYLLGPSLLVAPVFSASGDGGLLPAGRSLDELVSRARSSRAAAGGTSARFDTVPLWVREGAVVPIVAEDGTAAQRCALTRRDAPAASNAPQLSGLEFETWKRMPRNGRVTLASVAEEAGVSLSTISKVLNGRAMSRPHPGTRRAAARRPRLPSPRRRGPFRVAAELIELVFHELDPIWSMEVIARRRAGGEGARTQRRAHRERQPDAPDPTGSRASCAVAGRHRLVFSELAPEYRERCRRARSRSSSSTRRRPVADAPSVGSANWSGGLAATRQLIELGPHAHRRDHRPRGHDVLRSPGRRLPVGDELADSPIDPDWIRFGDFHVRAARRAPRAARPDDGPPRSSRAATCRRSGVHGGAARARHPRARGALDRRLRRHPARALG
jgi:hypothetical protein